MLKFNDVRQFAQYLFEEKRLAHQGAKILTAILQAQSPRLSEIAQQMSGTAESNYKQLQRFLAQVDPQRILLRLFQEEAEFVIGDPTEIPRPQAKRTPYVGTLKDGQTKGFWLLLLATPFRGRALPFSFVTYSSRTIAETKQSRNLYHAQAFANIKDLLGDKPLVLDREFSYLELLKGLVAENVHFVIRLNLGSQPPTFTNDEEERVQFYIAPGQTAIYRRVFYKGAVAVNVIGRWREGLREPLWVMTDLEPERGFAIYLSRMKIEETFRDVKSLLHLDKVMNKQQAAMEKMVALVLLAFSIGVLVGEEIRDELYGVTAEQAPAEAKAIPDKPARYQSRKWRLYSGLFIVLKRKVELSAQQIQQILRAAITYFVELLRYPVRTHV